MFIEKGTNNLGIGIGPGLAGIYGTMSVPAISVGYQAGVHENISVGGLVGYSSSTYDGGFFGNRSYEWTYSYIVIGARGEYHFTDVEVENLDLYSGLTLGYTIVKCLRAKRLYRLLLCSRKLFALWVSCWGQVLFFPDNWRFFGIGLWGRLHYGRRLLLNYN
jgi:hypothetical protein